MAVTRIKAYHGAGNPIKQSIDYSIDKEKTDMSRYMPGSHDPAHNKLDANTQNALTYAANPQKTTYTDKGIAAGHELVTGYMCDPDTASEEFRLTMDKYYQHHEEHLSEQTAKRIFRAKLDEHNNPVLDSNGDMIYDPKAPVWHDKDGKCMYQEYKKQVKPRTAYMWVLSFPPERVCGYKIDPRLCHQIGLEFIKQIDGGQYQAVVATHMDREHPHNHIVMCAYAKDGSHKYRDTKESLMKARKICDDLSERFGLPIIPSHSQEQSQTISWKEWKSRQEGQSWKEQMRQDINSAVRIARDYEQFIDLMKASGYRLRETENHLTYIMPGEDEYRCRDTKLGKEYEKNGLKAHFEKQLEHAPEKEDRRELDIPFKPTKGLFRPIHIRIARYTFSGRRRTDLEMVFLTAIKLIQALKDLFRDETAAKAHPTSPIHRDTTWKLKQMTDSLKFAEQTGIESKKDLDSLIKETGTRLSVAKKELKELEADKAYAEKVSELLKDAAYYMSEATKIGYDLNKLYVVIPDKSKVRDNLAKENPARPAQRRDLYLLLQKYGEIYRLGCKYDQLNAREAASIIDFLQKKSSDKPDILYEGRWKPETSRDSSPEEIQKRENESNTLFESHLWDYSPTEQQILLHLRNTVKQLADLGISMEDYKNEKIRIDTELDHMKERLRDVEDLKQQYKNIKRLEYNYNLAMNTAFTHGPAYEKDMETSVDVQETREVNESEERRPHENKADSQANMKQTILNPFAFSFKDPYFDQTHSI
nr:relaxase/mobilization nuclease domain-containing protein [uncultured Butyrivibrio sp.]